MYRAIMLCVCWRSAPRLGRPLISTAQEYPKDKADRLKSSPLPAPSASPQKGATVLAVDPSKKKQTIEGFGGAFTTPASVFSKLNKDKQEEVLEAMGSTGQQYNLARLTIGSTDFSTSTTITNRMARPLRRPTSTSRHSPSSTTPNRLSP